MIKVIDKVVEPSKVLVGSTFLLKIKIFRGLTYEELRQRTYTVTKNFTYGQIKKGE